MFTVAIFGGDYVFTLSLCASACQHVCLSTGNLKNLLTNFDESYLMIGTCESEISLRIESRVKSAVTIRIRIESRIESRGNRLHVQRRLSCGSCVFNNV